MDLSERARTIKAWFGLPDADERPSKCRQRRGQIALPAPGEILLISGPSGAGKSTLLRALRRRIAPEDRCDLNQIKIPRGIALIDCFANRSLEQALALLSRVGLAEAHSYLLDPRRLSEGQRWRLRLAICMERMQSAGEGGCILCDEFTAALDRITAKVVAHRLRSFVRENRARAILASSHEDLLEALRPDLRVKCDFGEVVMQRMVH